MVGYITFINNDWVKNIFCTQWEISRVLKILVLTSLKIKPSYFMYVYISIYAGCPWSNIDGFFKEDSRESKLKLIILLILQCINKKLSNAS